MTQSTNAQWYVKELSALTKVSVRTLYHYDRIDLLKPSVRLSNGYRLYSESDLLMLQQILALKFFGFDLASIKSLLQGKITQLDHLHAQKQVLVQKVKALEEAVQMLTTIIEEGEAHKSIPWESVIKLIGVYRMTQELEQTWAAKVYTPEQLKQFAALKSQFSEQEIVEYEQKWINLIEETQNYLDQDPASSFGKELAKRWLDLVNSVYGGAQQKHLRTRIWEAYKNNEIPNSPIPQNMILWIDRAMDAYYRERIYGLLSQTESLSHDALLKSWEELMDDMYGNEQARKDALYEAAMTDDKVSVAARNWLKKTFKL